ncbi:CHAT domain-containing tetratricopeptide repeat protein [Lignipirellula cremea]|uniref:Photosystem I assembly protein Ycf3 n=1 Tax=Lignipirellula cremea TaxID=2528010 RepID=A0A518DQA7_9BACT|nr:tetratricopeptide repeat protein [Lignipirellula cremea]QDU94025.1 photosystem I assembly protein Ycf3 [Lignipirellula cremea]
MRCSAGAVVFACLLSLAGLSSTAVASEKKAAGALLEEAKSLTGEEQLEQAEKLYRDALRFLPQDAAEDAAQRRTAVEGLAEVLRRRAVGLMNQNLQGQAAPVWREVVKLRSEIWAPGHWQAGNAERAAQVCEITSQFTAEQKREAEPLGELWQQLNEHRQAKQFAKAKEDCLAIRKLYEFCYGKEFFLVSEAVFQLAQVYEDQGDDTAAESTHRLALEMRRKAMGLQHPNTAVSLSRLATLVAKRGDEAKARELFRQSAEIYQQCYSEPRDETAYVLHEAARMAHALGDYDEAAQAYAKSRDAYEHVNGKKHASTALAAFNLGMSCEAGRQYSQAKSAYQETLATRTEILGGDHPDTLASLNALAKVCREMEDYPAALAHYRKVLGIRQRVHGEEHALTAESLENAGNVCVDREDFVTAEKYLRKSLAIRTKLLGEQHADTASSLHALGKLFRQKGDRDQATAHFIKALEIRTRVLPKFHADTAESQYELAMIRDDQGRYAEALLLAQQSLWGRVAGLGDKHPAVADTFNLLATLHEKQGSQSLVTALYLQALAIRQKAFGEQHEDTATSLCNLGLHYASSGNLEEAGPLLEKSLKIRLQLFGSDHPDTANSYSNLGLFYYLSEGDLQKAESLFTKALEIFRKVNGAESPEYATCLNNLGYCSWVRGNTQRGEKLVRDALAIRSKVLGEAHPDTISTVVLLAGKQFENGDYQQAAASYERCLLAGRQRMTEAADFQSERQQLQLARKQKDHLSVLVSLALTHPEFHESAFRELLEWKGSILLRQRQMRVFSTDPKAAQTLAKLKKNAADLAASLEAPGLNPDSGLTGAQIMFLSTERDQLEAELGRLRKAPPAQAEASSLAMVAAAQPADSTLLTYFKYIRIRRTENAEDRFQAENALAVFVLRPGESPQLVDLGPISPIANAIAKWRQSFGQTTKAAAAAHTLKEKIWTPIQKFLGDDDLVVISPDGELEEFPFAVLPGKLPDSYLLEDYRIAILPVPQLLPELVRPPTDKPKPSQLLLVGGLNYDAEPANAASVEVAWRQPADQVLRGGGASFASLPGTVTEIAEIATVFKKRFTSEEEKVVTLTGLEAGENQFCEAAGQFTHLHLATHGYFASVNILELADGSRGGAALSSGAMQDLLVDDLQPGLHSGLAFSGANLPATGADDGILTAADIAALQLDGVDLVVLSACESGLGKAADGEGMLGVQRAFQVAGARTTIASLWPVGDVATQLLMTRFYHNLWEKKMNKLDALREAQLHLLNHPDEVLDHKAFRGDLRVRAATNATIKSSRLSPQFWAAFCLSGSWE